VIYTLRARTEPTRPSLGGADEENYQQLNLNQVMSCEHDDTPHHESMNVKADGWMMSKPKWPPGRSSEEQRDMITNAIDVGPKALAAAVCECLNAKGVKEFHEDREAKLANIFEAAGLDKVTLKTIIFTVLLAPCAAP